MPYKGEMEKLTYIQNLLKDALQEKGYEIIQLRYLKTSKPTLQFLIDRLDEAPVTIEDCTQASRLISGTLDVEDPIQEAYVLEVSSPGVDRPLSRLKDYERFQGHPVKFDLHELSEGRKRFKGVIQKVTDGKVTFFIENKDADTGKEVTFSPEEIYHCKLSPLL